VSLEDGNNRNNRRNSNQVSNKVSNQNSDIDDNKETNKKSNQETNQGSNKATDQATNKVTNKNNNKIDFIRRKRINRIKFTIILIIILLLLLPSICCIVLMVRVNSLQKQVNQIAELYGINQTSENNNRQAYAAVKNENNEIIITPALFLPKQGNTTEVTKTPVNNTYSEKKETIDKKDSTKEDDQDKKTEQTPGIYSGKKVYLTFDDGPSRNTVKILDILDKYKIKATFFVIGRTDAESKKIYKRIVKDGHTLGMHSYSHRYEKIYNSIEDFDKDFTKLWKLLYDTTGYKPTIYRFPGGSDNLVNENGMKEFVKYLKKKQITYYDWNVVNGDATNIKYTQKQLVNNVLDGLVNKERAIVLMHDSQTKESTMNSLPELINKLIAGGAQLLPLDKDVKPIQMMEADSIK
jgi:peptidoglycan/xylan/chitin deacetylase (PgdA/CDA1 family)